MSPACRILRVFFRPRKGVQQNVTNIIVFIFNNMDEAPSKKHKSDLFCLALLSE
jgi:hypothetical protein